MPIAKSAPAGQRRRGASANPSQSQSAPRTNIVVGAITPETPAKSKDARAVARYRAEHRHTEAGNAERFVATHGESLRFHSETEFWLAWQDTRWAEAVDGLPTRLALETVRKLINEDPQFVVASERRAAIDAALSIAADLRTPNGASLRVRESELNRRLDLLPVANGVVDLRTSGLREGRPEDLMSRGSHVVYDETATSEDWNKFIDDITCGDKEFASWLQRWAGYCATGETSEQAIVFLTGEGSNGKGAFTRMLEAALGDVVVTGPASTLATSRWGSDGDAATPTIARMAGRRLVLFSEGKQEARLAEDVVKNVTGEETIVARMLNANPIEFKPTAKLLVSTNHRPVIVGTDKGIWRRVKIAPMRAEFSNSGDPGTLPIDRGLEARLRQQLPAILAWIVRGAVQWYEHGLGECTSVSTATGEYREEMDRVGSFIDETYVLCELANGQPDVAYKVKAADVYREYVRWCEENGVDPLSQNGLSRELGKKGLPVIQSSGRWRGGLRTRMKGEEVLVQRPDRELDKLPF
jgi:putative DNA primase/helicase